MFPVSCELRCESWMEACLEDFDAGVGTSIRRGLVYQGESCLQTSNRRLRVSDRFVLHLATHWVLGSFPVVHCQSESGFLWALRRRDLK